MHIKLIEEFFVIVNYLDVGVKLITKSNKSSAISILRLYKNYV